MRLTHQAFEKLRMVCLQVLSSAGYDDIGLSHSRIVQHIVYSGGSLSEIARQSGISRQAVAKTVSELESAGYVRIKKSMADQRVSEAELTEAGQKLFSALRTTIDQVEGQLKAHFGARDMKKVRRILEQIGQLNDETTRSWNISK